MKYAPIAAASLPADVPVSMPLLVLDVHDDGSLTATLDGTQLTPPVSVGTWRRSLFGQIIDHATQDRALPVRVEVRESDGTTFTDILPATKRPAAPQRPDPAPKPKRGPDPILVDGGAGFIAGEDVAVALITGHTDASHEGRVRALLDPAVVTATRADEVLLVGRVSGTVTVRRLS